MKRLKQLINQNEYLWIHLEKYDLNVGVVYKPPSTKISDFIEFYNQQLEKKRRVLVFGDFNINLLNDERNTNNYKSMLDEAGYKILNNMSPAYCTRETITTKSTIDHIATNIMVSKFHMALLDTPLSDHKQLYLAMETTKQVLKKERREYLATNYSHLYKSVEESDFSNDNNNYEVLENFIKRKVNENKVTKIKILNKPQDDWINKAVLNSLYNRNDAWRNYKQNPGSTEAEKIFKTKRYEAFKILRNTKNKYYLKSFENCNKQPKKCGT